jgi:hypothetical protein
VSITNWSTVRTNGEPRPSGPSRTDYTPAMGPELATLAEHLINDHGYQEADIAPHRDNPSAESWAILERLHWSAQILSAPVILNTTGKGPS